MNLIENYSAMDRKEFGLRDVAETGLGQLPSGQKQGHVTLDLTETSTLALRVKQKKWFYLTWL